MGIQAGWLAVRGLPKSQVLERLGLAETEESGDWSDFALACGERPGGWTVVLTELGDLPGRAELEALSQTGEALTCEISETVMVSEAQGFAGGRRLWRLFHDGGSKGARHLQVEGAPPAPFAEIRDRAMARPDDRVDHLFDVPVDLVFALCGFRANGAAMPDPPVMTGLDIADGAFDEDEDDDHDDDPSPPVRAAQAPGGGPRGIFARLFGRR